MKELSPRELQKATKKANEIAVRANNILLKKEAEENKEKKLLSMMRPALREGYTAVTGVLRENGFVPGSRKIKYSSDGHVISVKFTGLTRDVGKLVEKAAWDVMVRRDEAGLDKNAGMLGLSYSLPVKGSKSNEGWMSLS